MTEQERREAVAAVAVHERQVKAAQVKVDGAQAKVDKFEDHLKAIKDDLKRAKQELADEEKQLVEVKKRADEVLAEGPVTITGVEVRAYAGVAQASVEGKGGNS
jgi:chromosome segregation ATPase